MKLHKVYGTSTKQDFLVYLADNTDRFYFYVEPVYDNDKKRYTNLLYCLDELIQETFIVGEVEYSEPILCDIKIYLIKPTNTTYYIDIVGDYIFYHDKNSSTMGLDSYELDKENYGLRVAIKDNSCVDILSLDKENEELLEVQ